MLRERHPLSRRLGRGLRTEWPTLLLATLCHASWLLLVLTGPQTFGTPGTVVLLVPLLTLYSSLQHEVLHGHPFGVRWLDDALVAPAYGLFVPYLRFRTLHLAHHRDESLTDPYEDPESNFLHPTDWQGLSPVSRLVRRANNTLLGRVTLGPVLGMARFLRDDWCVLRRGDADRRRDCRAAWAWHALALLPVACALAQPGALSAGVYALAAFCSLGLLRVRTFLEHRAHVEVAARTVIIESRGPLAFLFLFNSLHAVHHRHPRMPWFRMHAYFHRHRAELLAGNGDYRYRSYAEVLRRYLLRGKDPVPHPLRHGAVEHMIERPARVEPADRRLVRSLQAAPPARLPTDFEPHEPTAALARQSPLPPIAHERSSGSGIGRTGPGAL